MSPAVHIILLAAVALAALAAVTLVIAGLVCLARTEPEFPPPQEPADR